MSLRSARSQFAILITVAVLARLALAFVYEPIVEGDAHTYVALADLIAEGRFHASIGHIAPVFPLYLAMLGGHPMVVWFVQSLLGILMAVLLFLLALRHTRRPGVALAVGLVQALGFDHLFYEPYLVTETLGTFLLVLALFLFGGVVLAGRSGALRWLGISLALSLGGLTRSLVLFILPLWGLFLFRRINGRWRIALGATVAYVLPAILLVGGWSFDNQIHHGYFGPSTMAGFRLIQHAGAWMERAPDSDATIRDVFLAHRARMIERRGTHVNTMWAAMQEIQDSTGLGYSDLSKRMNAIALTLIRDQPLRYAASVSQAWVFFWSKPIGWKLERIRPPALAPLVRAVGRVQRAAGIGLNGVFLALALTLLLAWIMRGSPPVDGFTAIIIVTVLIASIAQATFELSDNGRFGTPFQPFVQYAVIVWAATRFRRRAQASAVRAA